MSRARSVSSQYLSSTIPTPRKVSRTTGSQGNKCLTFWRWRMTSLSGVSQRSRPPQALQRFNRDKCAHLLRDLAATADLPPHCALFSQQLLDLTTGGGLKLRAPSLRRVMSTPWRQRLIFALNCTPPGTLTRLHFSFQTLGSGPAPSLTFSRLLPLFWTGANLTTCRLCTRLRLCMKLWSKNTASWSQRTSSW